MEKAELEESYNSNSKPSSASPVLDNGKRKTEGNTEDRSEKYSKTRSFRGFSQPRSAFRNSSGFPTSSTSAAPYASFPTSSSGNVLAVNDHDDYDYDEDMFTADQVNQIVQNAIAEHSVLATQGQHFWPQQHPYFAAPPQLGYGMHPQVFLAGQGNGFRAPGTLSRTQYPCRFFAPGAICPYGDHCKFVHATQAATTSNEQGVGGRSTSKQGSTPASPVVRNPFERTPSK